MKFRLARITLPAVAVVLVAFPGESAHADWADALVSYWDFDATLADDPTYGSGNNGTMSTGTATYAAGKFGNAIDLPGPTGNHQHVRLPEDDDDFDFASKGNGLSISTWIKAEGKDGIFQTVISKGEWHAFRLHRFFTWDDLSYCGAGDGGGQGDLKVLRKVTDGAWHHVVAVTETTGTASRLYVDGSTYMGSNSGRNGLEDNDLQLLIGNNPQRMDRGWNGLIDDMAIWGRPLSTSEVDLIYNNGTGTPISLLVPEPSTIALLVTGALGLLAYAWRRRKGSGMKLECRCEQSYVYDPNMAALGIKEE